MPFAKCFQCGTEISGIRPDDLIEAMKEHSRTSKMGGVEERKPGQRFHNCHSFDLYSDTGHGLIQVEVTHEKIEGEKLVKLVLEREGKR